MEQRRRYEIQNQDCEVSTLLDGVFVYACDPILVTTIGSSQDRRWTFGLFVAAGSGDFPTKTTNRGRHLRFSPTADPWLLLAQESTK